jgi:RHS repeat-associated protein
VRVLDVNGGNIAWSRFLVWPQDPPARYVRLPICPLTCDGRTWRTIIRSKLGLCSRFCYASWNDPYNGSAHPTKFEYYPMNRLKDIIYPDGTTVSFGYDSRGRRTTVTDQNQNITHYGYDDADRLTSILDAANNLTQYGYDNEDNLTSIIDGDNNHTTFTPDTLGRVRKTTFPSTLFETYDYDELHNLKTKTDRKGQIIQYVYDSLYRLKSKTYPDSTAVDYYYDLVGKIKSVTDPTGSYGSAYDNMGRLIGTTTQFTFLPAQNFQNGYSYDAASNRASLTAPDGSTNLYKYDTLNRLQTLTNSLTGQFGFGYDVLSRRKQLTRPNGINTNYTYDPVSHLLSVLHQKGTTTPDGSVYTYDYAGNRQTNLNKLNGITSTYGYDAIYELKLVTQPNVTTESYGYDAVGNRLSSLGVSPYNYNASNELTSTPSGSYGYDYNGNTQTDPSGKNYTWDFENRLVQAVVPGTGTVTFKYDPLGRRIQKSSASGTTNYLHDGLNLLEQVDQSGSVLARYTQGDGIDNFLAMLRSGTTSYFQTDALGTVTSLSNSAGTIANTYSYDSYGKLIASSGTITSPLQYTGREFDSETGLYYYRVRYYDPTLGRFLNEDPLGFGGGNDFYRYVDDNPINFEDPLGLLQGTGVAPAPIPTPQPGPITGPGPSPCVLCIPIMILTNPVGLNNGEQQWIDQRNKQRGCCQPCIPPVGTIAYRLDTVPPSKPHFPHKGTHWHLYQMNQNPNNCQCFWNDLDLSGDGPTPAGSVPITPAGGGGPL